jgi:hypothetical protein
MAASNSSLPITKSKTQKIKTKGHRVPTKPPWSLKLRADQTGNSNHQRKENSVNPDGTEGINYSCKAYSILHVLFPTCYVLHPPPSILCPSSKKTKSMARAPRATTVAAFPPLEAVLLLPSFAADLLMGVTVVLVRAVGSWEMLTVALQGGNVEFLVAFPPVGNSDQIKFDCGTR